VVFQVEVFRFVTSCSNSLHPEDGGSMDLWNIGTLPQHFIPTQKTSTWNVSTPFPILFLQ